LSDLVCLDDPQLGLVLRSRQVPYFFRDNFGGDFHHYDQNKAAFDQKGILNKYGNIVAQGPI
jgi:hypothetical protein